MGILDETRYIERLQFFEGQRLHADDMQDVEAVNREMRWLHNRSLHQPGIGKGFAVQGARGDRLVAVGPGYALDALGREIVLTEDEELRVPPVAGEPDGSPVFYDLVVSYPDEESLEETETRARVCDGRGVIRRREAPDFCWVRLKRTEGGEMVAVDSRLGSDVESGLRLVLSRAEVLGCMLNRDLSFAQRRQARPASTPHIACGRYAPDPWSLHWFFDREEVRALLLELGLAAIKSEQPELVLRGEGPVFGRALLSELRPLQVIGPVVLPIGLRAKVDTRGEGFQTVPSYSPRLAGQRIVVHNLLALAEQLGLVDRASLPPTDHMKELLARMDQELNVTLFVDGLLSVVAPQPDGFTLEVALLVQLLGVPSPDLLRSVLAEETLRDHAQGRLADLELAAKWHACMDEADSALETCVGEAVDMAMELAEEMVLRLFVPPDWAAVWMGVEG